MADILRFKDIFNRVPNEDGTPLSFKDMYTVEYKPGEDELVNYRAMRRKRTIGVGEGGYVGESTESGLPCSNPGCTCDPCTCVNCKCGNLKEALDLMQRMQRARLIRRIKTKIKIGKEKAKRKVADVNKLRVRARKAARNILAKKLTSGVPKGQLNAKRKQEIEKRLEKMGPAIDRIAKKMFPIVRKKELEKKRKK